MNLLFISTHVPVPVNNGRAIRTFSIVQALASSGHKLTFMSFAGASEADKLGPLAEHCETIELVQQQFTNMTEGSGYLGRLRCLLSLTPYSIGRFRSGEMRAKIERQLQKGAFDMIFCDSLYALENVPQTNIPIALNCHNVEYVILHRYAQTEKNPVKKWYANIESRLLKRAEQKGCSRAVFAIACSEHDRDILRQSSPDLPIYIVPNAIDSSWFDLETDQGSFDGKTILFQGGMDWYPNRDAVEFFVRSILPLVRAECGDLRLRLVVAGRNAPPDFVNKFRNDPDIEFTGTVPDMKPFVLAATLVVVPLQIGSGTRIKILEACAAGRPVVSTSVGAEGLGLRDGKDFILADKPADFARGVTRLLRDPGLRHTMGLVAREFVRARFMQSAVRDSVDTAVSDFSDKRCATTILEPIEPCLQEP